MSLRVVSSLYFCLCDRIFQEIIQEQITRVLLERLVVNRPHPWGLLITFIELIKVTSQIAELLLVPARPGSGYQKFELFLFVSVCMNPYP